MEQSVIPGHTFSLTLPRRDVVPRLRTSAPERMIEKPHDLENPETDTPRSKILQTAVQIPETPKTAW